MSSVAIPIRATSAEHRAAEKQLRYWAAIATLRGEHARAAGLLLEADEKRREGEAEERREMDGHVGEEK